MKFYILLTVFLYGCTSVRNIDGVYWSDKSPCKFTMNKDSTFSFEYRFQFQYEHATGTWSRAGKSKYVLNSFVKNKRLPASVSETKSDKEDNSNFLSASIQIPNQAYYRCEIFINDTLYEKRSCDSLSSIVIAKPMRSLFLGICADERIPGRLLDTLYTEKFYPRSEYRNNLKMDISYIDSLFNYRIFNNETIRIANKKLVFYDNKHGVQRILREHSRKAM